MKTTNEQKTTRKHRIIKLGVDVALKRYAVTRMIDGATPQPTQMMTPRRFEAFARKQLELAHEVHCVYEAGPTGFVLYRQLEAMGVRCYVTRPVSLKLNGRTTDRTDSRQLVQKLDSMLNGNQEAVSTVYVPTEQQERLRAQSRLREQLRREVLRVGMQGRSFVMLYGHQLLGRWWRPKGWALNQVGLPDWMKEHLEILRRVIVCAEEQLQSITESITKAGEAKGPRPKGFGALSVEELDREVCNWDRFKNRRTIGSYTGLCGGVEATGKSTRLMGITKCGNARIRHNLVEMAWRATRFQSECALVKKWQQKWSSLMSSARGRKRAIVALARQLAIAIWRWRTGRVSAQELGFEMVG